MANSTSAHGYIKPQMYALKIYIEKNNLIFYI